MTPEADRTFKLPSPPWATFTSQALPSKCPTPSKQPQPGKQGSTARACRRHFRFKPSRFSRDKLSSCFRLRLSFIFFMGHRVQLSEGECPQPSIYRTLTGLVSPQLWLSSSPTMASIQDVKSAADIVASLLSGAVLWMSVT